jgi:hypothetical protein
MQRAIIIIRDGRSFLAQGCHWNYGQQLHDRLTAHHATAEDARELVIGNRIGSVEQDGKVNRNTPDYPRRRFRTITAAARVEEHITIHYHDGTGWQFASSPRAIRP